MGTGNFVWWVGVLESRQDPLKLGRGRVRILGWHTDDRNLLPTESLPWAHPILPLNNPTMAGLPPEGSWVVGFFRDGAVAQEPIMWGVIPAIPPQAAS